VNLKYEIAYVRAQDGSSRRDPVRITDANGATVCEQCSVATTVVKRFRGLMLRKCLADGEGLLLSPAGSIHTFFMRFPIDVVFADRDLTVVDVVPGLRPWRMAARRRTRVVFELPAGEAERRGVGPGTQLEIASAREVEYAPV
jgi:uncharacterized membrane protein (UPF0127 family)